MPLKRDSCLIPLSHDHHHGLARAFEIRQALAREGADLNSVTEKIRDFFAAELVPHFRAEEDVLFPALAPLIDAGDTSLRRLTGEHRQLERLVAELDGGADPLRAFADLIEPHIRFEERQLFEVFQQRVPADARPEIEAAIRRTLNRPRD